MAISIQFGAKQDGKCRLQHGVFGLGADMDGTWQGKRIEMPSGLAVQSALAAQCLGLETRTGPPASR
jgi:hypothetical protein